MRKILSIVLALLVTYVFQLPSAAQAQRPLNEIKTIAPRLEDRPADLALPTEQLARNLAAANVFSVVTAGEQPDAWLFLRTCDKQGRYLPPSSNQGQVCVIAISDARAPEQPPIWSLPPGRIKANFTAATSREEAITTVTGEIKTAILEIAASQTTSYPEVAPSAARTNPTTDAGAPVATSTPTPAAGAPEAYVIGPQDVLRINVWKEPEMSAAAVPVRPDGMISIALVGDVQAAGLTPPQLSAALTEKIKKFVQDPQVTVTVTAINSQRIYVLGEVGHAGPLAMLPDMNVLQALSSAGGLSQFANAKKIYVLRTENGVQRRIPFNYKQAVRGKNPEQNILLQAGDTIVVP